MRGNYFDRSPKEIIHMYKRICHVINGYAIILLIKGIDRALI